MATNETKQIIEKIKTETEDLTRTLQKTVEMLTAAGNETVQWTDATKKLKSSMEEVEKLQKSEENYTKRIQKNIDEIGELALEYARINTEIADIDATKSTEIAAQGLANQKLAAAIAASDNTARVKAERELRQINATLLALDAKRNEKLNRQADITTDIIPALNEQNVKFTDQLNTTKQLTKEQEKLAAIFGKISKITEPIKNFFGPLVAESKDIQNMLNLGTTLARAALGDPKALLQLVKDLGVAVLERWIALEKAGRKFREETGLLVTQTREIDKAAREINTSMQYLGVTLENAYKSAQALYSAFGTTALITKDMMQSTAQLAANLGISEESTAKFTSMFESIAKSSGTTSKDLIKATAALSKMAGVAPAAVMKDMANASGATLTFLAKSPVQLMRASVEARRLGTDLKSIADSARTLLNYEESVNAELNASALLGRSVSFQYARQLAFEGKIMESRKAALDVIKSVGDFTKLTVYQQEALAKAAGMTVEEITKMQNQEKMLNALKTSGNAEDRKMFAAYEAMNKKLEANNKDSYDNLVAKGREMARQALIQGKLNELTNAFSSMWNSLVDALLPIANVIMPIIVSASKMLAVWWKFLGWIISSILAPLQAMVNIGNAIVDAFKEATAEGTIFGAVVSFIGDAFGVVFDIVGAVVEGVLFLAGAVAAVGGAIFVVGGIIEGTLLPSIAATVAAAWPITAPILAAIAIMAALVGVVKLVGMAFDALVDVFDSVVDSLPDIGQMILDGITSMWDSITDALVAPFEWFFDWFSDDSGLAGQSPSEIGDMMLDGILAVGTAVMDALTWPFRKAWEFIKNIPFVGWLLGGSDDATAKVEVKSQPEDRAGEIQSQMQESIDAEIEIQNTEELQGVITELNNAVDALAQSSLINSVVSALTGNSSNAGIEEKLDKMIDLLANGGVRTYLDGRDVSSGIANASGR